MSSCVRGRGFRSDWFDVRQGTFSPFLYLLFIDELIYELEKAGLGLFVYAIFCGCPTVADDMLLSSFLKKAFEKMLAICLKYVNKWRFEYAVY